MVNISQKARRASVYTVSANRSFVDVLAAGLINETADDQLRLANYTILLPTRRACRALTEAFLRQRGGAPLILPSLLALGDTDEECMALEETPGLDLATLPPVMPDIRRILTLADQILAWRSPASGEQGLVSTPGHALLLAGELARFLDQVQTERLSFEGLEALVPEDLAAHWQDTLEFLRHFTKVWPLEVQALGFLEPIERRNRLLEAKAEQWMASPPQSEVIAAGSTGSIPATADLLAVIAGLPLGRILLPGLDIHSDEENWSAVEREATHPQFAMANLLKRIPIERKEVKEWCVEGSPEAGSRHETPRISLLRESLRPAETTTAWQSLDQIAPEALSGLSLLECANETEEAGVIALLLRHVLETNGKTGALVTSDRRLARRVAAALGRWNISIDDSSGIPLSETPPAIFMRLIAAMVEEDFAPVAFLAFSKHPLAAIGYETEHFRSLIRIFDRYILRGPRPSGGISGLRGVLASADSRRLNEDTKHSLSALLDALERCVLPVIELAKRKASLNEIVDAYIAIAESLSTTDTEAGAIRLWAGENGEALALFFAELRAAADAVLVRSPTEYPAILEVLLGRHVVRPRHKKHPRLNIWGPLEARMQQADFLIIGGLNEGSWPREPNPDPWLSKPMLQRFGLPSPEQRIGLSAHDFAQAIAGPNVVLTRARKVDGAPTVPTRWLSRLRSVLTAAGHDVGLATPHQWIEWHQMLGRPKQTKRILPPAPIPPIAVRPKKLSVTRVEEWMRDPYSIYARYILNLRKLDPLEADPGAADRGTIIHEALDVFLRKHADHFPDDALTSLLDIGKTVFGASLGRPAIRAFWWPRFERIAEWFVEKERGRRAGISQSLSEGRGHITISTANGPFTLTAIVDRIDRRAGGGMEIIDYKTGAVPSRKEVEYGYSPQLSLEAAIATSGGFEKMDGGDVETLAYWRLTGGDPSGEIRTFTNDDGTLSTNALLGLERLLEVFSKAETAYQAIPAPAYRPRYNDFEHLERFREWADVEGD
ncbi:MAG: double-strand break repair protein AddB [Rhodospirillaceae bacterium]|nr:double-strand break repair protein AddB [Rhodospirillaceae bacterium]